MSWPTWFASVLPSSVHPVHFDARDASPKNQKANRQEKHPPAAYEIHIS